MFFAFYNTYLYNIVVCLREKEGNPKIRLVARNIVV